MNTQPKNSQFDIAWQPHSGSQTLALSCPANEILYHGTRGPGKTDAQLMRFFRLVGMGYGSYWRGIIFDREYKNLDDLVVKSKRWFYELNNGGQFLSSNSDYKWKWPTGEELLFRQAKTLDDYWSYHGHEYPFIGWNELTKYADLRLYEKMRSINRSGFIPEDDTPKDDTGKYLTADGKPLPKIPLEIFSTCNPYGPGHNAVKRAFIDIAPSGRIVSNTVEIFDPKTKQDIKITRKQVAIFGNWRENPNLDPQYIAGLYSNTDENEREAWLNGNWDIVAGGALDDKWKKHIHVVSRFKVPKNWHIDRGLDWGSSHPFSVGWFAEANGEEVRLEDGRTICPKAGTIIQFAEWYGTKAIGTNVGLKLGAKEVARGVKRIEDELISEGWIAKKPYPGPADNQISEVREATTDSIEKMMADEGIRWERSDKASGSRVNGLQLMRDRLEASINGEGPGLLFMDNCRASIATIPVLPRDEKKPDDVDTTAEDHPYDMVRYRILKGNNRTAKIINVSFAR